MKVLITTSGVGSRLGDFTEFTNKSLVPVGDKPALGHIIDAYPETVEFVITVGHHGDLVRQFVSLAYPDRQIDIVDVANFSGPGSSLGLSMLSAEALLQEPFVYNAGDTICSGLNLQLHGVNWLGGVKGEDSGLYASFDVAGKQIISIHPKGTPGTDFLYIGLAFIFDVGDFWTNLSRLYHECPSDGDLNDLSSISEMVSTGLTFELNEVEEWLDVGSLEGLRLARQRFATTLPTLEKRNEAIFYLRGEVVKFFSDPNVCAARVNRAERLAPQVPPIVGSTDNWYSYRFVEGRALGDRVEPEVFGDLLGWAETSLWSKKHDEVTQAEFQGTLKDFYFRKSEARLSEFEQRSGLHDGPSRINGSIVASARDMLAFVENSGILKGFPSTIHGDFILDNIIHTGGSFVAIDWRHSFGRAIGYGDRYYDLAKLNHSLTMNHAQLSLGKFECLFLDGGIWVDIDRKASLTECESVFRSFLLSNKYDLLQLDVLTPLIWLNMAPLHTHPLDIFLYHFGRLQLSRVLSLSAGYNGEWSDS